MSGKFEYRRLSDIDISDPFFDSLKADYQEFESRWFPKCCADGREALVFYDEHGLGAFVAAKGEFEPISLSGIELPARSRIKISTLMIAERFRGQRLGEGAIGLLLWMWQKSLAEEIYITVFPSHSDIISQLTKFGFDNIGINARGEFVFLRSKHKIDYSNPYRSFPFISPGINKGGYLIVNDVYHDTLFPYSELKGTPQELLHCDATNGVSKVYISQMWETHLRIGEPVFIYRRYTGTAGAPRYKSCVTSYCVVTDISIIKSNYKCHKSFDEFCAFVGNKSVYTLSELTEKYNNDRNIMVIKLLYCGYFGSGNNLNMDWLENSGLWVTDERYPAHIQLSRNQCEKLWLAGNVDLDKVYGE